MLCSKWINNEKNFLKKKTYCTGSPTSGQVTPAEVKISPANMLTSAKTRKLIAIKAKILTILTPKNTIVAIIATRIVPNMR